MWCRATADGAELDVWVVPGGSRSAVRGEHDGRLRLAVAAPPEDGKANRAVARLIGDLAGVGPHQVQLVRGTRSRAKTFRIETARVRELIERLGASGA